MDSFKRFFGREYVATIDDPVLGRLCYDCGTWTHVPERAGSGFLITVDAPESGPSKKQRDLFQKLTSMLPTLEKQARDFIQVEAACDTDAAGLSLFSLEIAEDGNSPTERFVMGLRDSEEIGVHRVSFEFGRPTGYTQDD